MSSSMTTNSQSRFCACRRSIRGHHVYMLAQQQYRQLPACGSPRPATTRPMSVLLQRSVVLSLVCTKRMPASEKELLVFSSQTCTVTCERSARAHLHVIVSAAAGFVNRLVLEPFADAPHRDGCRVVWRQQRAIGLRLFLHLQLPTSARVQDRFCCKFSRLHSLKLQTRQNWSASAFSFKCMPRELEPRLLQQTGRLLIPRHASWADRDRSTKI